MAGNAHDDARARLDPLRTELGGIDKEILALITHHQAVAQQMTVSEIGMPTRDFRQEKDVVQRARAAAVQHGLSEEMGEELILALIGEIMLAIQEKNASPPRVKGADGTRS